MLILAADTSASMLSVALLRDDLTLVCTYQSSQAPRRLTRLGVLVTQGDADALGEERDEAGLADEVHVTLVGTTDESDADGDAPRSWLGEVSTVWAARRPNLAPGLPIDDRHRVRRVADDECLSPENPRTKRSSMVPSWAPLSAERIVVFQLVAGATGGTDSESIDPSALAATQPPAPA